MEDRDVVISAFATPSDSARRELAQPIEEFESEPIIVSVDALPADSPAGGFARAADSYRDSDGFILRKLIATRVRDARVRRIALVGFSAGCTFLSKVLSGPDAPFIDAVIALDGVHVQKLWSGEFHGPSLAPWMNFGVRAALGAANDTGPLFVNAHTHIRQGAEREKLVGNTQASAEEITARVRANSPAAARIGFDSDLIVAPPPPPAVTLTVNRPLGEGRNVAITKTWDVMPMPAVTARGNYFVLDYGGGNEADHVFIAWYAQRAIWRTFLEPRWSENIAACPTPLIGLGQDDELCRPRGIVAPPGIYETHESPNWGSALLGLLAGFGIGWWAGSTVLPGRYATR